MTDCRNETEAHLALAAAAMDRGIDAVTDARIAELAREDVPADPPLRAPGEPVRIAIGEAKVPPAMMPVRRVRFAATGELAPDTFAIDAEPGEPDAGELAREDVRPGMRKIGGQWFYSAAWI